MKNKAKHRRSYTNSIIESTASTLIVAILGILFGILSIFFQNANNPILRSEAIAYTGQFEKYEEGRNYRTVYFEDDTSYEIYPHTYMQNIDVTMQSIAKGTKLFLLVNPNNSYVLEIKTENVELLNFETAQEEICSYDNGYVALGVLMCVAGVFLLGYAVFQARFRQKEKKRLLQKKINNPNDDALKRADHSHKSRVLLDAKVETYSICYRRVKTVNELVINGLVYDEIKALIEFPHKLVAVIDGHTIEAGLCKNSYSYIRFDGAPVAEKRRWI